MVKTTPHTQDDRKYDRESINPRDDHPAGLSPTKIIIFAGPDMPAPLRRGEPGLRLVAE